MAGINYKRLQATMKRMTTENGDVVKLTRPGKTERIDGRDVVTPSVSADLVMTRTGFTDSEIRSGRVETGDIRLATGADFEIKIGDRLHLEGTDYRVVDPGKIKPGTIVIGYRVWARL